LQMRAGPLVRNGLAKALRHTAKHGLVARPLITNLLPPKGEKEPAAASGKTECVTGA
jgi:hypothetical protein